MSWKDHPIVIAAATCVATLGVCYELLIPAYTTTLENQVAKDIKIISELKEATNKAQAHAEQLDLLNKNLLSDNAFASCNPYPRAFSEIKIGDPSQRVFEKYGKEAVSPDEDNRWLTVETPNDPIFTDATYYVEEGSLKVRQILFFFKDRVDIPPLSRTHDPKKETATQLAIIKQLGDALPQIVFQKDKSKSKAIYTGSIDGEVIYKVEQNMLLITPKATALSNKMCTPQK